MLARPEWNEPPERDAFSLPLSINPYTLSFTEMLLIAVCGAVSLGAHLLLGWKLGWFG